jgi:hypothetical protein
MMKRKGFRRELPWRISKQTVQPGNNKENEGHLQFTATLSIYLPNTSLTLPPH